MAEVRAGINTQPLAVVVVVVVVGGGVREFET
jgi:hypothetical protein